MPIYEFQCPNCKTVMPLVCKIGSTYVPECTFCDVPMPRIPSAPAIQFRGTGWTPKGPGRRV